MKRSKRLGPDAHRYDLATDHASHPDLMGGASAQIQRRGSDRQLHLAERLWNYGDPILSRMGDRLVQCTTNDLGWRCGLTSVCLQCGRRAAIRERLAIQARYRDTPYMRALVTRTLRAPSIREGHSALVTSRRAQNRSSAWRAAFLCGRGRIEAKRTRDDGAWLVHAHELTLLGGAVPAPVLRQAWSARVCALGLAGSIDIKIVDEGGSARSGGTFRSPELLRLEAQAVGATRPERRRTPRVGAHRADAEVRGEVRPLPGAGGAS